MKIGYARVSTEDQNLDLQRQALEAAGCERIYEDRGVSGAAINRPALKRALKTARPRDVLVVWKLDRLGRDLRHLVNLAHELTAKGLRHRVTDTAAARTMVIEGASSRLLRRFST